jgi:hypothetical protein
MLHLELKDLAVLGADLAVFWRIVLCYRLGTQEVWQRLTWIQNNSGLPQGLARPSAAG